MEQKRAYHGMGFIQNVIYVFGGFQKVSDEATLENYPKSNFAFDVLLPWQWLGTHRKCFSHV